MNSDFGQLKNILDLDELTSDFNLNQLFVQMEEKVNEIPSVLRREWKTGKKSKKMRYSTAW